MGSPIMVAIPDPSVMQHFPNSLHGESQHSLSLLHLASIPKIYKCPLEDHNLYQFEDPTQVLFDCVSIFITFHTAFVHVAHEVGSAARVGRVTAIRC